eukprot:6306256-Prymnesium_polylepis.1
MGLRWQPSALTGSGSARGCRADCCRADCACCCRPCARPPSFVTSLHSMCTASSGSHSSWG